MAIFTPLRWPVRLRMRWVVVCRSKSVRPQEGQATWPIVEEPETDDEVSEAVTQQRTGENGGVEQAREKIWRAADGRGGSVADPDRRTRAEGTKLRGELAVTAHTVGPIRSWEPGIEGENEVRIAEVAQGFAQPGQVGGRDCTDEEVAVPAGEGSEGAEEFRFAGSKCTDQEDGRF